MDALRDRISLRRSPRMPLRRICRTTTSTNSSTTSIGRFVFISGGDPIATGLVSSLSRPGGNATGVNFITALGAKRLDLLHALLPNVTLVALLTNPNYPLAEADKKEVQGAAHVLGRQLLFLDASTERELETAFETLVHERAGALLVTTDSFFMSRRDLIVALAARYRIPAI